jgi:xanthine dehydrogenase accessory factor
VRELAADIARWRARGERFAVATVVGARRSAPRPIGSKLLVSESGEIAGSVSGGCVESDVFGEAREVLAGLEPRLLCYGISDELAATVGLPCGGEIDVFVEESPGPLVERVLQASEQGERAVHLTVIEGPRIGAEALVIDGGEVLGDVDLAPLAAGLYGGKSRVLDLEDGGRAFAEVYGPAPRVLAFGAIDTAESLCAAAKLLGWRTVVVDARARFATPERLPSADEIVIGWPDDVLPQLRPGPDDAIVVLTHEERFDLPALAGALASEAFYIGALGSRVAQAARRERLLEAGIPEEALERLRGPCGLDLGATSPAETAVSILTEIMATRAERPGGPLRERAGGIRSQPATAA